MAADDRDDTEEERKRRQLLLSQEIAQRYSPDRLRRIVVDEAGRGEHLDVGTQSEMEKRLGGTFQGVRVFRGPFAEAITRQHRADAVTIASTGMILVREGPRSDPKTALGKALLAHELTHVRQAQSGLHFALEGGGAQNAPHEAEAEHVEAAVHAEASGAGALHGGAAGSHTAGQGGNQEEKRRQIMKRVYELLEENTGMRRARLGLD
jgi:Domain of unknown function (DUF4157)